MKVEGSMSWQILVGVGRMDAVGAQTRDLTQLGMRDGVRRRLRRQKWTVLRPEVGETVV